MNFEQLSQKYRNIKSPVEQQASVTDSGTTNNLFDVIKKQDAYSKKQSKRFYIITSIVAVVYIVVFIINPDPDLTLQNRLAGGAYILASVILAFLYLRKHNKIKNTIYLSSTKNFLEEARKRFSLWNKNQLWLVLVVLLVDIATMFSMSNYFDFISSANAIIISQLIYFALLAFGLYMGKKQWKKTKKPILEKIEEMLAAFEDEK